MVVVENIFVEVCIFIMVIVGVVLKVYLWWYWGGKIFFVGGKKIAWLNISFPSYVRCAEKYPSLILIHKYESHSINHTL